MSKPKRKRSDPAPNPDLVTQLLRQLVLVGRLLADRRVSWKSKLIPLGVLVYMISPIDFLPDILFPIGIADDLGVLVFGLQFFIQSAPPDVVEELRVGGRKKTPHIIDGEYTIQETPPPDPPAKRR